MNAIDRSLIEQAHKADILAIAQRYTKLKRATACEFVGACPCCGGRDRFSVNIRKHVWNCRVCGTGGDAIKLLQHVSGATFVEAVEMLCGEKWIAKTPLARDQRRDVNDATNDRNGQLAARIWQEAIDAHGTPVERYLTDRGLMLPRGAEVLRFHPSCPFGNARTLAMIALVRNIESNAPQAIHRTALDVGDKITRKARMALGPIAGGAIKLTADEEVTIALGMGEGVETTLSLQRLPEWAGSPVWSLISKSGVSQFPVLSGIETLVIAADHDPAGGRATVEVTERWELQGRKVLVLEANKDGADLNDIL